MFDPRDPSSGRLQQDLLDAKRHIDEERYHDAELIVRRLLAADPGLPDGLFLLGLLAARADRRDQAIELLRQAIAGRKHSSFYLELSRVLKVMGREQEALDEIESGLQHMPNNVDLVANRGQLLSVLGRTEEAIEEMERAVELNPGKGPHFSLAMLREYQRDDPHLLLMEELLARGDVPESNRLQLLFGAGRAWHSAGDYDRAFELYAEGNRLKSELVSFDLEEEERNLRRIVAAFQPGSLDPERGSAAEEATPVLVVGLPRSGTTLVEQILAAHPQVEGVGEVMDLPTTVGQVVLRSLGRDGQLPEDLARVTPAVWRAAGEHYVRLLRQRGGDAAARLVDKQLFNDTMVGLVNLMLPRARIIHCLRDPMDNGLSCFMANFEADRGYVYDLRTLGRTYRLHEALMEHWHQLLPEGVLLTVRYEDMVDDVEAGARRIIDHIGLPWDEACLRFHEVERAVRTMSQQQVRQPIYRSAVGRWKRYEEHLGPLAEALAEPVDLHAPLERGGEGGAGA